ncbi:MAG: DUF4197 domain-containing protein [Spirosomataceae bacterium]
MTTLTRIITIVFLTSTTLSSCGQQINLGKIGGILQTPGLTQNEVVNGLKEALSQGATLGAQLASQEGGFQRNPLIRIPLPTELQQADRTLRSLGLGPQVDQFLLAMNRGAEQAAKEAAPIFIQAIRQMTITDAMAILRGEKDAATQFLRRTTGQQLMAAFQPVVKKALDQTLASKYYGDIATTYNRVPLVKKINPDIQQYATEKAIDGLFLLVAQEEAKIRENPMARTTDLLKKVFGSVQ